MDLIVIFRTVGKIAKISVGVAIVNIATGCEGVG